MKLRDGKTINPSLDPVPVVNVLTRGVTARNRRSRLLQLPAEIREQIFKEVIGTNSKHIFQFTNAQREKYGHTKQFGHYICQSGVSPQGAEELFLDSGPSANEWNDDFGLSALHMDCACPSGTNRSQNSEDTRSSVALLYTCRSIYHDTKALPAMQTGFIFNSERVLDAFSSYMMAASARVVLQVEQLELCIEIHGLQNVEEWAAPIEIAVKTFIFIKELHIVVHQNLCLTCPDCTNDRFHLGASHLWCIFRRWSPWLLRLREVTVRISDTNPYERSLIPTQGMPTMRLPLEAKQELALSISEELLEIRDRVWSEQHEDDDEEDEHCEDSHDEGRENANEEVERRVAEI